MTGLKKYGGSRGSVLMLALLLSLTGRAQEKNSGPIHKDTLLIHFDFGQAALRPDARSAIDSVWRRYGSPIPWVRIELYGHCDNVGGNVYNDRLSLERIGAVRHYLRSKHIPDSLFGRADGYGKRKPVNDNADEEQRSLNRRVEIVIYRVPLTPAFFNAQASDKPAVDIPSGDSGRSSAAPPMTLTEFFRDSARAGKTFVLRNLNFEVGRHVLLPYSDTVLRELLKIMLDSPRMKIEIRGHVCCIAPWLDGLDADTRTEDLSVRRARFVYEYLRQRGVKASRMSYRGFGASQKLYPEERNEQEEEMNRRVEIKRKNPQD
jgi:outer membrane protein OmpA-like peptidoglycan-associated protein